MRLPSFSFLSSFLFVIAFGVCGCAMEMGSGGGGRTARDRHAAGTASLIEQSLVTCQESGLDPQVFANVSRGAQGTGKTNGELFAAVRRKSPKFAFVVSDVGVVSVEGAKGPEVEELKQRMMALSTAKRAIEGWNQSCHVMVYQRAMGIELSRLYDDNITDPAIERAVSKKAVAIMKRFDVLHAGAVGVMGLYESAARGADASAIDKAAKAAGADMAVRNWPVTDADVDALWTTAREKAAQLDNVSRTWGPEKGVNSERERRALLGVRAGASAAPARTTSLGAGDASSGFGGDVKAVSDGLLGLFQGNIGAVIKGAAVIFPKDSPMRAVFTAGGALASGDFVTALKSAQTLAPKDSAIGAVLATANQALSVGRALKG